MTWQALPTDRRIIVWTHGEARGSVMHWQGKYHAAAAGNSATFDTLAEAKAWAEQFLAKP